MVAFLAPSPLIRRALRFVMRQTRLIQAQMQDQVINVLSDNRAYKVNLYANIIIQRHDQPLPSGMMLARTVRPLFIQVCHVCS
jgi:hypothetical protein